MAIDKLKIGTLPNGYKITEDTTITNPKEGRLIYDMKGNIVASIKQSYDKAAKDYNYSIIPQGPAGKSDYDFKELQKTLKNVGFEDGDYIRMGSGSNTYQPFKDVVGSTKEIAAEMESASANKLQGKDAVAQEKAQSKANAKAFANLSSEKNIPFKITGQGAFNVSAQDIAKWQDDGTIDAWKAQGVLPEDTLARVNNVTQQITATKQDNTKVNDPNTITLYSKDGNTYYMTAADLNKYKQSPASWKALVEQMKPSTQSMLNDWAVGKPIINEQGNTISPKDGQTTTTGSASNLPAAATSVDEAANTLLSPDTWYDYGGPLTLGEQPEETMIQDTLTGKVQSDQNIKNINALNAKLGTAGDEYGKSADKILSDLEGIKPTNYSKDMAGIAKKAESNIITPEGTQAMKENADKLSVRPQNEQLKTSQQMVNDLNKMDTSNQYIGKADAAVKDLQGLDLKNSSIDQILNYAQGLKKNTNPELDALNKLAGEQSYNISPEMQALRNKIQEQTNYNTGDLAKNLYDFTANPLLREADKQAKAREASLAARGLRTSTILDNLNQEANQDLNYTLAQAGISANIEAQKFGQQVIQAALAQGASMEQAIAEGQAAAQARKAEIMTNATNARNTLNAQNMDVDKMALDALTSKGALEQGLNEQQLQKKNSAIDALNSIANTQNQNINIGLDAKTAALQGSNNIADQINEINRQAQNGLISANQALQAINDIKAQAANANNNTLNTQSNALVNAQNAEVNNANVLLQKAQQMGVTSQNKLNALNDIIKDQISAEGVAASMDNANIDRLLNWIKMKDEKELLNQNALKEEWRWRVGQVRTDEQNAMNAHNGQQALQAQTVGAQNDSNMAQFKVDNANYQTNMANAGKVGSDIVNQAFKIPERGEVATQGAFTGATIGAQPTINMAPTANTILNQTTTKTPAGTYLEPINKNKTKVY